MCFAVPCSASWLEALEATDPEQLLEAMRPRKASTFDRHGMLNPHLARKPLEHDENTQGFAKSIPSFTLCYLAWLQPEISNREAAEMRLESDAQGKEAHQGLGRLKNYSEQLNVRTSMLPAPAHATASRYLQINLQHAGSPTNSCSSLWRLVFATML